jgi:hypothetical protein
MQENIDTQIFSTAEAYAWSPDFDYEDYKRTCFKFKVMPFCEAAYSALKGAFDIQMDYDMTKDEILH